MRYLYIFFFLFSSRLAAQPVINSEDLLFLTIDKEVMAKNNYKGLYMYDALQDKNNSRGIYLFNKEGKIVSQDEFFVMNGDEDTFDLKTNYYYDAEGLLIRRTLSQVNRRTGDTSESTQTNYVYEQKRIVKATTDNPERNSSYVYNAAGKLISITELDYDKVLQSKAEYSYDGNGRIASIKYTKRSSYDDELNTRTIKCLYDKNGILTGLNGQFGIDKYGTNIVFNDKGLPETQHGRDIVTAFWYDYKYCSDCKWK